MLDDDVVKTMSTRWGVSVALMLAALGCAQPPPASQFPSAQAAIDRMRATQACALGVRGDMNADYFGDAGRVRGHVKLYAKRSALLRLDIINPFTNGPEATLTADGRAFALTDMRNKQFLHGPAQPCNIGRLLGNVQLPGHVIVSSFLGQAPVLKHDAPGAIAWDGGGYYVVTLAGTQDAREEIHLTPVPADFGKPWAEQRVRVLSFSVVQKGYTLYKVELDDHRTVATAAAYQDPEHIDPDIPPSGPACNAEVPYKIWVVSPHQGVDLRLRYDEAAWNPPLRGNEFQQQPMDGLSSALVTCE